VLKIDTVQRIEKGEIFDGAYTRYQAYATHMQLSQPWSLKRNMVLMYGAEPLSWEDQNGTAQVGMRAERGRRPPTAQLMVPLVGIIFGGVIEAVATFIAYENEMLQMLGVWQQGDFSGVLLGRYELLWATGILALFAYLIADQLTILGLGETVSVNLGLNRTAILWSGLIIVALITSLVVVTVGNIPFIGLVVPNIISRLMGDKLRQSLPAVALLGASLVLLCDIVGRVIVFPFEIPVSTVFGVMGTALFLWLLLRKPAHAV